jgi:Phage Tail Collar Domain
MDKEIVAVSELAADLNVPVETIHKLAVYLRPPPAPSTRSSWWARISQRRMVAVGTVMALLGAGIAVAAAPAGHNVVPSRIGYRGHLDRDGLPLDGSVNLGFRLYRSLDPNGPVLWEEQQRITTAGGDFSVELGAVTPIPDSVVSMPDLYLGLVVEGQAMDKRQHILATPFAQRAGDGVPPGTVISFAGPNLPSNGWLPCRGQSLLISEYPQLYAALGNAHGSEDAQHFYLPDLRGRFLRGVSGASKRDIDADLRQPPAKNGPAGNNVGSVQGQATRMPSVPFRTEGVGDHQHHSPLAAEGWVQWGWSGQFNVIGGSSPRTLPAGLTSWAGAHNHALVGGDSETRPENVYVEFLIKY